MSNISAHPKWNINIALALWATSVVLVLLASPAASLIWVGYRKIAGLPIAFTKESLMTSGFILLVIGMSFLAHLLTLAICYTVVTKTNGSGFLEAFGWQWHQRFGLRESVTATLLMLLISAIISSVLPNGETDFEKVMKISSSVRIATALLAVVTAPLVEEVVYRGVLFAPISKVYGTKPAILIVSALFVAVHLPQYWGGWAVLVSLTMLSVALTLLRAATGSLLPCFAVHTLFNAVNGLFIVISGFLE
ncbi:MAG: type II CAAX endopeptidase family protein [Acidobacteriota bacterium]|nr:CPBP family intramembrane metalloprotease [Blastocatellia bacterium]MDW8413765.1 type II CAAX endopeptidase family protein [Acidobacteriota bacterium]